MDLARQVKTALDEVRMLTLGAQILLGFQLQGAFREAFDTLPALTRGLNGIALMLLVATLALLIAPAMHHRLVEQGRDSGAFHRYVTLMATLALLPLALGLGLDVYIVTERVFGRWPAAVGGAMFALLALSSWYGVEWIYRRHVPRRRNVHKDGAQHGDPTPLPMRIEQMLTEARVILPGAQALLGFQLVIMLTHAFDALPVASKLMHAISLGCIALTVILLMAPAAFHRLVYEGLDSEDFHRIGSVMVTLATVPLALGLAGDVYVVMQRIGGAQPLAIGAGGAVLASVVALWHGYPLIARMLRRNGRRAES